MFLNSNLLFETLILKTTTGTRDLNENSNTISITYPEGGTETLTIVSINETNLVVTNTISEDFDFDSVPTEYTYTATLTLQ